MDYPLEILPIHEVDKEKKKRQTVESPKGALALVHGICHGARCWENFINFFADHGYQCYAISLPGHGGSGGKEHLQAYRLSDYVEAVKEAIETIKKDMEAHGLRDVKPFLLGHSMGGAVVQQYIGKYPDTVGGAVLFASATAPCMSRRETLASLFSSPEKHNLWCAFKVALGCKKNWAENVHNAAFFTGENEAGEKIQRIDDTSPYESLLQKESKWILLWDLYCKYSENYRIDVPIFVIGSRADAYFPEESLEKTAGKYAEHKEPAYECLNYLCHDMMLDPKWEEPAELVREFMENPAVFIKNHPRLP